MARLSELIERLQELQESLDHDPEVLIALQPSYPLQESIAGTWVPEEDNEVIYLVSGGQPDDPYAPRAAHEEYESF